MSLSRTLVHAAARRIEGGRLELVEDWPGGESVGFGSRDSALRAQVVLRDPVVYRRVARTQSIGLGETYAEGLWEPDDLVEFVRVLARDIGRADSWRRTLARFAAPIHRLGSFSLRNTKSGARRNISRHYDLGNDMFELWLDRGPMMYSSARYEHPEQSLEDAQLARLDHICDSLELGPTDHLLEIGTGWGGLAIHAARSSGCKVTTTTISDEQRTYAERRIEAAGLSDRITVLGCDYRDLEGRFDKLVSIEMIEAVGWEYFDTFFRRCSQLLEPDGLLFLQAIVIDDRAFEAEKRTRRFANEVIFPGGCLPSIEAIQRSVARTGDLSTIALEDITPSYALTLREWRHRFNTVPGKLEMLGYDEHFRRIWNYYLASCEAAFTEARIRDVQMLFSKPKHLTGAFGTAAGISERAPRLAPGSSRDLRREPGGLAGGRSGVPSGAGSQERAPVARTAPMQAGRGPAARPSNPSARATRPR